MKRSNKFQVGRRFRPVDRRRRLPELPQNAASGAAFRPHSRQSRSNGLTFISSGPWPAEPFATCTEIAQFPDGKVVSVQIKGRSATYDPAVPPYFY